MVALLSLKMPYSYHYSLRVEFTQVSISWEKCTTPTLVLLGFEACWITVLDQFRLLTSCRSAVKQWQNGWDAIIFDLCCIHNIFLLTLWVEAVFCDYKLGLLTMQEETNPLWFNNFLAHFGTTANTCIEVPHDHQVVRWWSSCDEFIQISVEFPPHCNVWQTARIFVLTKEINGHLISPYTDQASWRKVTT